jgi:hypothetical protein
MPPIQLRFILSALGWVRCSSADLLVPSLTSKPDTRVDLFLAVATVEGVVKIWDHDSASFVSEFPLLDANVCAANEVLVVHTLNTCYRQPCRPRARAPPRPNSRRYASFTASGRAEAVPLQGVVVRSLMFADAPTYERMAVRKLADEVCVLGFSSLTRHAIALQFATGRSATTPFSTQMPLVLQCGDTLVLTCEPRPASRRCHRCFSSTWKRAWFSLTVRLLAIPPGL